MAFMTIQSRSPRRAARWSEVYRRAFRGGGGLGPQGLEPGAGAGWLHLAEDLENPLVAPEPRNVVELIGSSPARSS